MILRYKRCCAEMIEEKAVNSRVYRENSGVKAFEDEVLTIVPSRDYPKPRHKKVEKNAIYAKYNLCRSFSPGTYQKHINFSLINRKAKSGILILRPHHPVHSDHNTAVMQSSRMFSMLSARGNKGVIERRPDPRSLSFPFLSRCLPSDDDLEKLNILSGPVTVKRGPGRPFGIYTPKVKTTAVGGKQTKRTTKKSSEEAKTGGIKRGRKATGKTSDQKRRRGRNTKAIRVENGGRNGDDHDDHEMEEEEEEEEEAEVREEDSSDTMMAVSDGVGWGGVMPEVPQLPTSNLPPILQSGEDEKEQEELLDVFDISTLVNLRS